MSAEGNDFASALELEIIVPESELRAARERIESGVGGTEISLSDPGAATAGARTDGGRQQRRSRREHRWARQRTDDVEEILEVLHSIDTGLGADGGGMLGGIGDAVGIGPRLLVEGMSTAIGAAVGTAVGSAIDETEVGVEEPGPVPVDAPDSIAVEEPDSVPVDVPREPIPLEDVGPVPVDAPDSIAVDDPSPLTVDDPSPLSVQDPSPLSVEEPDPVGVDVSVSVETDVGTGPGPRTEPGDRDRGLLERTIRSIPAGDVAFELGDELERSVHDAAQGMGRRLGQEHPDVFDAHSAAARGQDASVDVDVTHENEVNLGDVNVDTDLSSLRSDIMQDVERMVDEAVGDLERQIRQGI